MGYFEFVRTRHFLVKCPKYKCPKCLGFKSTYFKCNSALQAKNQHVWNSASLYHPASQSCITLLNRNVGSMKVMTCMRMKLLLFPWLAPRLSVSVRREVVFLFFGTFVSNSIFSNWKWRRAGTFLKIKFRDEVPYYQIGKKEMPLINYNQHWIKNGGNLKMANGGEARIIFD